MQTVQNGATQANYASLNYQADPGNTLSITLGNGATEQPSFNDRLQQTGLSINSGTNNLLTLGLFPCASQATSCASGNNGNLQSQTISLPGLSATQTYGYDNLNRLTSASETTGWSQAYAYAGSGNRYVTGNTGLPSLTLETPIAASWYSSNNRINSWSYDNNGNVLTVGSMSRSFSYDAENRQVTASINGTMSASYVYDGLGQRVQKIVNGATTTYVYDAFGNLAAEYGPPEASPCGTATCYVSVDHLGSTRMLTDSNGAVQRRYDYLPYGGELLAGIGNRTAAMGYQSSPDDIGPKFTSQSREPETVMDWFNVRDYSAAQGRFQSVDPGNAGADPSDPQTWNMYSYVSNNPLSYTDPTGECWWCILVGGILDVVGAVTLDPGLFAAGSAVEGISTAATIAGEALLTAGTGLVAYGTYDAVAGGGSPGIANELGIPGMPGSDQTGNNGPWSERAPFPLNNQSPSPFGTGPFSNSFLTPATVGAYGGAAGIGWEVLEGVAGVLCVGTGVCETGAVIGAGAAVVGAGVYGGYVLYKGHSKGARPSTEQKHQEGDTRRQTDRGGEKGDARRRPPRTRPPGWKGPWPPAPGVKWW